MNKYKTQLADVIKKYGVVWAPPGEEFTLASGAKSNFYIDFSLVVMVPLGAATVVTALYDSLQLLDYDCVGGPSSGADSIVGGLMTHLAIWQTKPIAGFLIRKEPKGRGPDAGGVVEGYLRKGQRAVVLEDVTTSGGSVLKAIKAVEDRGATVVKVLTLLDRQAGATTALQGYNFEAILTLADLHPLSPPDVGG